MFRLYYMQQPALFDRALGIGRAIPMVGRSTFGYITLLLYLVLPRPCYSIFYPNGVQSFFNSEKHEVLPPALYCW